MPDTVIRAHDLSKRYRIGGPQNSYKTLRDTLTDVALTPFRRARNLATGRRSVSARGTEQIWALRDVSFEIKRGEVVGMIGRNGSGKSTLLKLLARITEPTLGYADIYGRVGSLLEVGTGFHAELSGRENIYLSGAILGMKRAEIDRKFDEIVAFSEIQAFIDTPVKHYSSGMYLRLAFGVAAHLEPEILLVDEVLAVGDADFQRKCIGKMGNVASEGRTVLFVSHNMGAIAQLCDRVLWLESGRLIHDGDAGNVVSAYLASGTRACSSWSNLAALSPTGNGFRISSARILNADNRSKSVIDFDKPFRIEIEYGLGRSIKDLSIICRLSDSRANILWTSWDTDTIGWRNGNVRNPGRYCSVCNVPAFLLKPGLYYVSIGAYEDDRKHDYFENVLVFEISEVGYHLNPGRLGIIVPVLEWDVLEHEAVARSHL